MPESASAQDARDYNDAATGGHTQAPDRPMGSTGGWCPRADEAAMPKPLEGAGVAGCSQSTEGSPQSDEESL